MTMPDLDVFAEHVRSNSVRLRTLVILRWFAITGQTLAVVIGIWVYGLQLQTGLIAMTIGASVIANLFTSFIYRENKRLSELEAMMMIVFDILQLGLLLFLTGGLHNPFALLLLAPVTIGATVLRLRSTVILGVMSIGIVTLLSTYYLPLLSGSGFPLVLPGLFRFGFWLALLIGVVFLALYARQVTTEMHTMSEALVATQLALAREQKLTDLGGVVAAAAHELGTPLATIKLVSAELIDELENDPELAEDARLIREQADRCRDILRSMGRAGKDDKHMRRAPLETVVQEAAQPHQNRGKSLNFSIQPETGQPSRQPVITRRPEVVHGLRNLNQNAVDFARTEVEVEIGWTDQRIAVRIIDDGDGFPSQVLGRIGDPFVRRRKTADDSAQRPGYEGMGLGLFIAKTLLERSGAQLTFANGRPGGGDGGAIVRVEWPRAQLDVDLIGEGPITGENQPILP